MGTQRSCGIQKGWQSARITQVHTETTRVVMDTVTCVCVVLPRERCACSRGLLVKARDPGSCETRWSCPRHRQLSWLASLTRTPKAAIVTRWSPAFSSSAGQVPHEALGPCHLASCVEVRGSNRWCAAPALTAVHCCLVTWTLSRGSSASLLCGRRGVSQAQPGSGLRGPFSPSSPAERAPEGRDRRLPPRLGRVPQVRLGPRRAEACVPVLRRVVRPWPHAHRLPGHHVDPGSEERYLPCPAVTGVPPAV